MHLSLMHFRHYERTRGCSDLQGRKNPDLTDSGTDFLCNNDGRINCCSATNLRYVLCTSFLITILPYSWYGVHTAGLALKMWQRVSQVGHHARAAVTRSAAPAPTPGAVPRLRPPPDPAWQSVWPGWPVNEAEKAITRCSWWLAT